MMRVCWLLAIALTSIHAFGQNADDDLPQSGLMATFSDALGNKCTRVDEDISAQWQERSPDPRIGEGKFSARWQGQLLVRGSGEYQFRAFVSGRVTVQLENKEILRGNTDSPGWITGSAVNINAGFRPLEVVFEKTTEKAQVALFWSGPSFQLEPLGSANLFHESNTNIDASFQRGRQLVHSLRCVSCHAIPTAPSPLTTPDLSLLGRHLRPSWIVERLCSDAADSPENRQMPHLAMTTDEGRAIAAYLTRDYLADEPEYPAAKSFLPETLIADDETKKSTANTKTGTSSTAKKKGKEKAKHRPSVQAGHRLFVSLGCLACHSVNGEGQNNLFGGGDLSKVGDKWLAGFLMGWLKDPRSMNPAHRMPKFDLTPDEMADLQMFLESKIDVIHRPPPVKFGSDRSALIAEGKRLVAAYRCNACHVLEPGTRQTGEMDRSKLTAAIDWGSSCLVAPSPAAVRTHRPWYRLPESDVAAIEDYLRQILAVKQPAPAFDEGPQLLESQNCLVCHPRGLHRGISELAGSIAQRYADQIEHAALLIPPSLNSIGDKLHASALRSAITADSQPLRSWLQVRMPKFNLASTQVDALVDYLVAKDRMPEHQTRTNRSLEPHLLRSVGARIVTSDGFGCTSCHAVNDVSHGSSPVNARGPNLGMLGRRVRSEWFYRWVANPLRVIPRVEMPAITTAVPGVLEGNLESQIQAVWDVLNTEGFRPPLPNPVRVVRRLGAPEVQERSVLLTDVMKTESQQWIKPMVVGLPNRHNILFDLQDFRFTGWWIGDVARQRTLGKTWYWELGSENLWQVSTDKSDIEMLSTRGGKVVRIAPEHVGQFRTELDAWRHTAGGLETQHRLRFLVGKSLDAEPVVVNIQQTFQPLAPQTAGRSGFRRVIRASHLPRVHESQAVQLAIRLFPVDLNAATTGTLPWSLSQDRSQISLAGNAGLQIRLSPLAGNLQLTDQGEVVGQASNTGELTVGIEYTTSLPVDGFPAIPESAKPNSVPVVLSSVPGFPAVQLDLPLEIMPTGFAWQPDGTMIVTSLRGNVWQVHDRDGNGFPESAHIMADELAAPFGAYATQEYVDVINKYGLVRLFDHDRDGFAERAETVASGWGHTADYHDWALGLPRTASGNYLVTLSCQQDNRSEAAAYLRGKVVELKPREPTRENPQPFSVEVFSGGHRFPIGIAMNQSGEAFVTDNQGNYNPFNELNHLQRGVRYGFINANERSPGFAPKLTPPAIDIPHPWTRSVNGICFLESAGDSIAAFGPFAGHLIGCEYDTRRLVRMSLQKVGSTFQGAIYPFSLDPNDSGESLLGPISCGVSPKGKLVVGNIRDSGWGAGQNIGNIVQFDFDRQALPPGIAEIRALPQGFQISFTKPLPAERISNHNNYVISSFTRTSTPEYGGDDQQRSVEAVVNLEPAADRLSVKLKLGNLKQDFVYEFHLDALANEGQRFFPAEAYYTMREIP